MKLSITDKIMNKVLYGDSRGFGFSHPTGKEIFNRSRIDLAADDPALKKSSPLPEGVTEGEPF